MIWVVVASMNLILGWTLNGLVGYWILLDSREKITAGQINGGDLTFLACACLLPYALAIAESASHPSAVWKRINSPMVLVRAWAKKSLGVEKDPHEDE